MLQRSFSEYKLIIYGDTGYQNVVCAARRSYDFDSSHILVTLNGIVKIFVYTLG